MSGLAATSPSESADRGLLRSQISARVTSRDTIVIHAFSCAFKLYTQGLSTPDGVFVFANETFAKKRFPGKSGHYQLLLI